MISLNIQPIPIQTFNAVLDNDSYDITLRSCGEGLTASIARNSVPLVSNLVCTASTPLLPYSYLQKGNFVFLTLDDAIPVYDQLGVTQNLIFASQAELEAL